MCIPRKLTLKEMHGFNKWVKELHEEDVKLFGEIVKRPESALKLLYISYLDKTN